MSERLHASKSGTVTSLDHQGAFGPTPNLIYTPFQVMEQSSV